MQEDEDNVVVESLAVQLEEERIAAQIKVDTEDRMHFIGGSDESGLLGLNPWHSPFEVYQEKTGEKAPEDLSSVERVQWGILMEDTIATMYMRKTGKRLRRMNQRLSTMEYGFPLAAQIDRMIVGDKIPLEIKNTDAMNRKLWGEEGSSDIALHYYPQVQQQILLRDVAEAEVAVCFGGNTLVLYRVPRDQAFINDMIEAARLFWQRVQDRNPPDPISVEEASLRWVRGGIGPVYGTEEHGSAAARMITLADEIKTLEAQRDALKLSLESVIGDNGDTLMVNGKPVCSWKKQERHGIDSKMLKEQYPDVAAACESVSEYRVFRTLKDAKEFM
jgi:putative phage-type endonuclease